MLRKTSVSLPEPRAALANTKDTLALSALSLACVRLTQNRLAISVLLSLDQVHGVLLVHERVPGHATPRRDVGRRSGIQRGQLQYLTGRQRLHAPSQRQHEVAAAEVTRVPLRV